MCPDWVPDDFGADLWVVGVLGEYDGFNVLEDHRRDGAAWGGESKGDEDGFFSFVYF